MTGKIPASQKIENHYEMKTSEIESELSSAVSYFNNDKKSNSLGVNSIGRFEEILEKYPNQVVTKNMLKDAGLSDDDMKLMLKESAKHNAPLCLDLLLEATGEDINATYDDGKTLLHLASESDYGGGAGPVISALLKHEGIRADVQDKNGMTPFARAVERAGAATFLDDSEGRINTVRALGSCDGKLLGINTANSTGKTPLMLAAESQKEGLVATVLRTRGIDIALEVDTKEGKKTAADLTSWKDIKDMIAAYKK